MNSKYKKINKKRENKNLLNESLNIEEDEQDQN